MQSHSPSIPDEAVEAIDAEFNRLLASEDLTPERCGDESPERFVLRKALEAAAPELYAYWAEGRVEAVAMQLAVVAGDDCFTVEAELPGYAERNAVGREAWRRQAREVLRSGLGDRSS